MGGILTFRKAAERVNREMAPAVRKEVQKYMQGIGIYEPVPESYVHVRKLPLLVYKVCGHARKCYRGIGKIFGYHDMSSDSEGIDPVTIEGYTDGEKDFLRRSGVKIPDGRRVLAEEIMHKMQGRTGGWRYWLLGKIGRDFIEGAAATAADRIAGRTGIYQREKSMYEELERRVGAREAFLGTPRALWHAAKVWKEYRSSRLESALANAA